MIRLQGFAAEAVLRGKIQCVSYAAKNSIGRIPSRPTVIHVSSQSASRRPEPKASCATVPILREYLSAENVMTAVTVADRRSALETIAKLVEQRYGIGRDRVFGFLWRREQIGSTALGSGVAIPHARIAGIDQPIVLILRLSEPIDFAAPDGKLVGMLFVILVPDKAAEEHLQILAAASQMFSDQAFRRKLEAAPDAVMLYQLLSQWPGINS